MCMWVDSSRFSKLGWLGNGMMGWDGMLGWDMTYPSHNCNPSHQCSPSTTAAEGGAAHCNSEGVGAAAQEEPMPDQLPLGSKSRPSCPSAEAGGQTGEVAD